MKYLVVILAMLLVFSSKAQQRFPTGFPTQANTGWNKWGYVMSDSGLIIANRDTTWMPKYSGTVVFRPGNKQFYWFDSTILTWHPFGTNIDTASLSNRINLKLNISDTVTAWLAQSSRLVDSMYRVNDSTVGYTIKGSPYTFQILGRSSGGGGGSGTVTSVALSMPSAFSVTGSPITGSGTFAVSGAGITSQYIRGNGTLATTDTGMIPNFHLKVRSLFSGSSPITYNSTTGVIGIGNANTSGARGAATFLSSDFSDNGSGLISLSTLVSSGACTNCAVTFGADGRATAYANGTGPTGASVDTIYRTPGVDSIYYTINSVVRAIKDSVGAGGSFSNNNVGGGHRWVKTPAGNIATAFGSNTIIIDSSSNSNGLTFKADTSVLATSFDISTKLNSSDTTNKWVNNIRRIPGSVNVEVFKNGSWTTAYTDSVGTTSGPPSLTATQVAYGSGGNTITSEAAFNYIAASNSLTVDTVNTRKNITDTLRFTPSTLNPNGLYLGAFGDSYTVGTAATVIPDSAYTGRLSSFYKLPLVNFAVTGVGAITNAYLHNLNVNYPNPYVTSAMFGLNNLRIGGGGRKTINKVLNGYMDLFCNHFSKVFYPAANNTVVTRSGSWTAPWASNSGGGKAGLNGAFSNTLNDYIQFAFTDSTVWFSVITGDGSGSIYTSPTVDVSIDGGLIETIDLNNQTDGTADGSFDGRLISLTRYYTGLSYGAHTIRVTNKSAGLYLLFDGFGTLVDKTLANTYIIFDVPKLNPTGYATAPANSSDPITDTMNVKIDSLHGTFPSWYPVILVRTNNYFNPHAGMSSDSVHANNLGHHQLFDGAEASIGASPNSVAIGSMIYASGAWYGRNDTALVKFAVGDVVFVGGNVVFNDSMKFGAINDKPVAIISNGRTAATFRQNQGVYGNVADFYGPIRAFGPVYAETGGIELKSGFTFSAGVSNNIGNWTGGGAGWGCQGNFTGTANSKFWLLSTQENGFYGTLVADNNVSNARWLHVARNGIRADSIEFPMGKIYFGEMTRVASADSVLTWDTTTHQVRLAPAAAGATTLYSGNGTLAGDRNVSSGGFTLRFDGVNNSDTLISISNTGTSSTGVFVYSTTKGMDVQSTVLGMNVFGTTQGMQVRSTTDEAIFAQSDGTRAGKFITGSTVTNTVSEVLSLQRVVTTGVGANGIGSAITFTAENTAGSQVTTAQFVGKLTTATNGAEVSQLGIVGVNNGSIVTLMTIDGNGNATVGTTNSIVGTATNNSAVAGNIGEEINSTVSTYTNYSTTATYQNVTSITLTAGDWDLSAFFTYSSNSSTITAAANAIFTISTTTASASGATEGLNINYVPQAALLGTSKFSDAIPSYRVSLSGTTTYYLNTQATFTLGNPQYVGSIRARRCR